MSFFDVLGSIFEKWPMTDLTNIIVSKCLVSYNFCMIPRVLTVTFGLNLSGAWGESDATFFCFLLCSHNPTKCWYLWLLDICSTDTIIFEDLDPYRHNRNIFYLLHPAAAAVIYCKRTSLKNCDLIVLQLFYNKTTWNTNCPTIYIFGSVDGRDAKSKSECIGAVT